MTPGRCAKWLAVLSLAVLLAGCAGQPITPGDPERDPWEAYNRKIHAFNMGLDRYVMRLSTHHKKGLGKKYVDNERLWLKTEEMVRRAMLHGAQGFLLKPFSEEELLDSVDMNVVQDGRWKLIDDRGRERVELYDLSTDPAAAHDLVAERPRVAAERREWRRGPRPRRRARRARCPVRRTSPWAAGSSSAASAGFLESWERPRSICSIRPRHTQRPSSARRSNRRRTRRLRRPPADRPCRRC